MLLHPLACNIRETATAPLRGAGNAIGDADPITIQHPSTHRHPNIVYSILDLETQFYPNVA
jgi:hypothetical protein